MHYRDEVFSIVASKLNNDIATIIMKMFKSPIQCIFEEAFGLEHSTVIPLEKDEIFTSLKDANVHFWKTLKEIDDCENMLNMMYFSSFSTLKFLGPSNSNYLHYQNFLNKIPIKNNNDLKNVLFVIRNNKIFLKKGETTKMFMSEIVDFTAKVVMYNPGDPVSVLEKGDVPCSYLLDWCNYRTIYALEDTTITFDCYITDSKIRTMICEKKLLYNKFSFVHNDEKWKKRKYLSDDDIKKYNLQKHLSWADYKKFNNKIVEDYFCKFFAW
jgi:hypothetical protein